MSHLFSPKLQLVGLEALDQVMLEIEHEITSSGAQAIHSMRVCGLEIMENGLKRGWSHAPVRLLAKNLTATRQRPGGRDSGPTWLRKDASLELFRGADGILGGSGPTLSCRNTTVWKLLLESFNVTSFFLDFDFPRASIFNVGRPSTVWWAAGDGAEPHRV